MHQFTVGTDLHWSVTSEFTSFKGILVRVAALGDMTHVGDPAIVDDAVTCAAIDGVAGLDHFNSADKEIVTGTSSFATVGVATMDITVVFDTTRSAFSAFSLTIVDKVDGPVPAPFPNLDLLPTSTVELTTSEPTAIASDMPSKATVTVEPTRYRIPSVTPSNVASTEPTTVPSVPPSSAATSSTGPTRVPTAVGRSVTPSNASSVEPTKNSLAVQSDTVTTAPTTQPVETESVDLSIEHIKVTFTGAQTISDTDLLRLETEMEAWFEAYYNDEQETEEGLLQRRKLQPHHRIPDVRTMNTAYHITSQDTSTTSESNTLSITQSLAYEANKGFKNPEACVVFPFADTPYKALLLERLTANTNSFARVSAISTPVITIQNDGGLTTGEIICLVMAAIISLILVAVVSYIVGKRNVAGGTLNAQISPAATTDAVVVVQTVPYNQPLNAPIAIDETAGPLAQSNINTSLGYKDQVRSVVGPNWMFLAIANPNQQFDTDGCKCAIPMASVLAASSNVLTLINEA